MKLSSKTEKVLKIVFPEEHQEQARALVESKCGRNIPFFEGESAEGMERIRFSVLKLSEGNLDKLCEAIDLAQLDWRDLLMAANFGNDTVEHERWYRSLIG